jgi:hypothetical protein
MVPDSISHLVCYRPQFQGLAKIGKRYGARTLSGILRAFPNHLVGITDVRFGSKADICSAKGYVRFAPNSDRESGLQQPVMSALRPKADISRQNANARFVPKADIRRL